MHNLRLLLAFSFLIVFFGCVENEIERYEVLISVEPHGSASISQRYMDHCSLATVYRSPLPLQMVFLLTSGAERSTLLKKPSPFLVRKTTNSMQRSAMCLTCQKRWKCIKNRSLILIQSLLFFWGQTPR